MRVLLDTSVFLRLTAAPGKIPKRITSAIDDADVLYLSSASAWEIAIKVSLGKLSLPVPAGDFVRTRINALSIEALDITHAHAAGVATMPFHHRDPFDRLIISQALQESLRVATTDETFKRYGVLLV